MTPEFTKHPLYSCWPFWALELDTSADTRTVEKAYTKILGLVKLQIPNAEKFATPAGIQTRDEFLLRDAKAILLDPEKRALAEFWYIAANHTSAPQAQAQAQPAKTSDRDKPVTIVDWKKLLKTL